MAEKSPVSQYVRHLVSQGETSPRRLVDFRQACDRACLAPAINNLSRAANPRYDSQMKAEGRECGTNTSDALLGFSVRTQVDRRRADRFWVELRVRRERTGLSDGVGERRACVMVGGGVRGGRGEGMGEGAGGKGLEGRESGLEEKRSKGRIGRETYEERKVES